MEMKIADSHRHPTHRSIQDTWNQFDFLGNGMQIECKRTATERRHNYSVSCFAEPYRGIFEGVGPFLPVDTAKTNNLIERVKRLPAG